MPTSERAGVALRGCRALVTGGVGFIGSHVVDELVRAGAAEILVVDNFVRGNRDNLTWALANGPVKVVAGDIRNLALVNTLMAGIDVVFHQAAIRVTQCAEEPRLALEVLVDGTYNVLEAAVRARVRKVVAASSASVYGAGTLYGAAKQFNEGLLRSFNEMHGLDYVALRYFNVYGPRMDLHAADTEVLGRWMEAIAEGKSPVTFGDGQQTMDFVHVEDVARANVLAAAAPIGDVALNIGSGAGEAQQLIGFESSIALPDGLRRLVAWWHEEQCAKTR